MKILDPGHDYLLDVYDGEREVRLTFVKRNDPPEKFPGNKNAYPGTQMQDVLRVLIDRCNYVYNQAPCSETATARFLLRRVIWVLEARVRHTRGQPELETQPEAPELIRVCSVCGHIFCLDHALEGK